MAQIYEKSIRYDRESRDYILHLNGELVGFASTYHEGEVALDTLVRDLLTKGTEGAQDSEMEAATPAA
jgi:hypothetical protein